MSIKCPTCEQLLDSARGLQIHITKLHGQSQRIKLPCRKCPKEFSTAQSLSIHMRKHKAESQRKKEEEEISKAIQLALLEDLTKKVEMMSSRLPENVVKSTSNMQTFGYIYLIQLREFLEKGEDVYKVGMTCQPGNKRFVSYPKGSKLFYQVTCDNCLKAEKLIIQKFKEKFVQMKDIGTEYFKGNHVEMFDIIYAIVKCERETDEDKQLPVSIENSITTFEKAKKYDQICSIVLSFPV
jgi:hypothetical protein